MNKKLTAFIICFFIFYNISFSQKKEFYLAPQIGLLNGNNHISETVGLTVGVANRNWVYGIGTSIDYYKFRSVPVYTEVKKMFGDKKTTPFLYADAGINISCVLSDQHQFNYYPIGGGPVVTTNFTDGHFVEAGTGVNIKNKKGKGFFLSLGYSSKTLKENWLENVWDPGKNETIISPRSNKYLLNRIIFKVGFRLF